MPYNRNEVIASVTEFYDFLTTHLHFYPSELKTPPPTGWPQITPPSTDRQRKSDTAIELLRHLPYLPGGGGQEKWIYDHTICADYTNKTVEQGVELELLSVVEDCPWEKLKDSKRTEHIVSLAMPDIASLQPLMDPPNIIHLQILTPDVVRCWQLHLPRHARWRSHHLGRRATRLLEL